MSQQSSIEWTDATWNPVRGCVKVSPGCAHCYAETFAERFRGVNGHPYEQGFDLRLVPDKLTEPLSWKKPRRVFVNSMSDLFQDGVPDEYIDRVFAVMALTPQHTYQVLTKRADRMREYAQYLRPHVFAHFDRLAYEHRVKAHADDWRTDAPLQWPLPNVWLGVSVENQHWKTRIDELRDTPAAVRFLSIEPLLEDIGDLDLRGIQWVIVGGESGAGARPFDYRWAHGVVEQCREARVACFVKQMGSQPQSTAGVDGRTRRQFLRDRKGGDPAEWPEVLRIREYPA